jgi:hypothetical protein
MATQPGLTDTSHDERRRSVANIRTEKTPMNEALTFNKDGAKRYADIHWPDGFHPEQADFFAHNEIVVKASCKTVWDHVIEAEKWPSWYSNSHNMKLLNSADGKLHEDTRFSGDTFGLHVHCRIGEFVANSRIGDSNGTNAITPSCCSTWTKAVTSLPRRS